VATFRRWNPVLHLKPNRVGISFNLTPQSIGIWMTSSWQEAGQGQGSRRRAPD
jgi:hypothetical protein